MKRIAISSGAPVVIADGVGNPLGASWGADGTILFAEQRGGIFRASANGGRPRLVVPAKEGETLVQGVMRAVNDLTAAANYAVSRDGTLVYVSGTQTVGSQLVWVDTEGHETPVPLPPRAYDQVVLSPDGKRAAVGIDGDKSVWIADLERGTLARLPADLGDQEPNILFFSTDGQRVASSAVRDGRWAVVWQGVDGTGAAEPLVTFDASVTGVRAGSLSPDSKQFAPVVDHPGTDLGIVTVGDPKSYRNFLATPAGGECSAISPDGHWIAYCYRDTGTYQVYVQRFPEGGGRLPVSINGGAFPHWSAGGNALTYMRGDGAKVVSIMRVPVRGLEGLDGPPTFGTPTKLFSWDYFGSGVSDFDMTGDGKRFLMITAGPQSDETKTDRLVLVQNWFQELKRLVPTK